MKHPSESGELQCTYCGGFYFYHDGIRCETCDSIGCTGCMDDNPGPVCPECRDRILPERIEPMLARHGTIPEDWSSYGFEFKWDGIRALTYWDGKNIRIESRNLKNITGKYPELNDLGHGLNQKAVLDGEIIALDGEGKPSFHLLQQRMHLPGSRARLRKKNIPVYYHIFDILHYGKENLMDKPYRERREILEGLKIEHVNCRVPVSYRGKGEDILEAARQYQLEGVVCKQLDSLYTPGKRSSQWRKVKIVTSGEFIIGGYRLEKNNPGRIGSLQIGAYNKDMKLQYLGGIGTGFNANDHQLLLGKLSELSQSTSPFDENIPKRDVIFVEPRLIAAVEYRRRPRGGTIQQGSYKGLRNDVSPGEIILEEAG